MTMYCLYGLEIYIKSNTEFYIILFLMNIHGDAASETLASEPLRWAEPTSNNGQVARGKNTLSL